MTFIDLHTHGLAGHDARSKDPDEYLKLAEAMAAHGTGAFLPTLFPAPIDEMRAVMKAVRTAMERQESGFSDKSFGDAVQGPAKILGVHLEGPFINPAKAGALDPSAFAKPSLKNFTKLTEGFEDVIKIITVAPELPGAAWVIEKSAGMGIRVNMGHSDASFMQTSEGRKAGATGVTHLFNAMSGLHHRQPGLVGYALADDGLYVELIADLAHVHPAALMLVLKCKPKDRVILVSDSLREAKTEGMPPKGPLYLPDEKTLAGSGITLSDAVGNMVSLGLGEDEAAAMASENPRRYLEGA